MKFSGTVTLQYDTPFSLFSATEWKEGLDWLVSQGFDGAEVCISNYEGMDVEGLKKELVKRNLECSTISTGQSRSLENISLLHEGEGLLKAQERLKQHIDAAVILESKVTLGLLRGLGTLEHQEEELDRLARNLEPVIDYAQQKNVTIVLEAINRYETALLNSSEAVMDFIEKKLGNPECVGVLWDIFHANMEDADFAQAIGRMGTCLKHVHIADSNRMFPGYGHIDFEGIVKGLKKAGYQEYMSFECLNLPDIWTIKRDSGTFIRRMREL